MVKRIIAVLAALTMIYGSTVIPQAHYGEPVKAEESDDRETNNLSESSSGDNRAENDTESAGRAYKPNGMSNQGAGSVEGSDKELFRYGNGIVEEPDRGIVGDGEYEVDETVAEEDSTFEEEDATFEDQEGAEDVRNFDEAMGDTSSGNMDDGEDAGDNGGLPESSGVSGEEGGGDFASENGDVGNDGGDTASYEYIGIWTISFYCPCEACCGQWAGGTTASGVMPSAWWTAATSDLPFGTILYVDGLGEFEVQDRGTGYGWIDIFVGSHEEALACGLQTRAVYIVR